MASISNGNRYKALIERVFFENYKKGDTEVVFERSELERAATELGISLPKNLGDVVYSIRYRTPLPQSILDTQKKGLEWVIEGAGRSRYAFRLVKANRIVPRRDLILTKIPDSTPEIIAAYALSDEQALLAKVRYNRLVDVFLGLTSYSLQNHLRTTVSGIGQIEIDELYVGVDHRGAQYIVPVQAKGGTDQLSVVQTKQDIAWCELRFPQLVCRAISAQFIDASQIAMFELAVQNEQLKVARESHYQLVPKDEITSSDLALYKSQPRLQDN